MGGRLYGGDGDGYLDDVEVSTTLDESSDSSCVTWRLLRRLQLNTRRSTGDFLMVGNQRHLVGTAIALAAFSTAASPAFAPAIGIAQRHAPQYTCQGEVATIVGTRGKDRIVGTAGRDVIVALKSRDYIYSKGGDDLICGGYGDDHIYSGPGNDLVYGQENRYGPDDDGYYGDHLFDGPGDDYYDGGDDEGYDYVHFSGAGSAITVSQSLETVTGDASGNDIFNAIGGVVGTAYDDVMIGDERASLFSGGEGDDSITLGDGYNIASGGLGDDSLSGGADFDSIHGNAGNDTVIGGSDDDYLYGDQGDDYLDGLDGPDWGDGGDGTDTCQNIEDVRNCEL